jgi:hypothetical protein
MGGRGMVSVIIREAQEEGLHPVGVRGGEYVRRGRGLALPLICGEVGEEGIGNKISKDVSDCESAEVKKEIKQRVSMEKPVTPVTHTRRLRWPRRGLN